MHNWGGSVGGPSKVSIGFPSLTLHLENKDGNFSIKSEHFFTNTFENSGQTIKRRLSLYIQTLVQISTFVTLLAV